MFTGEEKQRKIVEKVIAATRKGEILWLKGGTTFDAIYFARWRGYALLARWLQDETLFSVRSLRNKEHTVHMSYRVMDGLREVILDQIDPHWRKVTSHTPISTASR
ncbi:hypothetical protein HY413_02860 [Candidatus Kaiserbacteria bacterium]|nr:hypothetical protein [Candidatus Kaiserbacteria bacterium]